MARGRRGGDPALYGKNIERRREGDTWHFKFKVDGVEYRGECRTRDKREAERIARETKGAKKGEVHKDRAAGLGPMTFSAACMAWWDEVGKNNKETGLEFRINRLRGLIGENKQLRDIEPADITRVKNERARDLRKAGKGPDSEQLYRPITPAAVKATMVTLRSVINYATKAHGAAVRMFDWTTWIKKDAEEHDVRVMTESEQDLLWPILGDLDRDVLELADFDLKHPKRINELIPLDWSAVDLKGGFIRIKLKGKSKLKDDTISPERVEELRCLKARQLHPTAVWTYVSRRTRAYNGESHVRGRRRPMTYQHFYEVWNEACARAGITDLNPHCIRHTGATRTYWATKDIYFVSELLNHSDITTTRRYYLKTDPEVARDMMRKVDERRKEKVSAKFPRSVPSL